LVAIGVLASLWLLLTRSWLGRAIRAAAQNPQGAALIGVDIGAVAALTFAIGVATTGAGGSLISIGSPFFPSTHYVWISLLLAFLIGVMAVGWNVISGFAGYVSLGQSAFIGIGAYTVGILALHVPGVSPWWWVPVGGVSAAAIAALLGLAVMRTRGHSFVILTIAFLFIMQLVAVNWGSLTGGSNGIGLPLTRYPREWQNTPFYYALLLLLALSVLMTWSIRRTKFGMCLIEFREAEDKAGAVGVSTPI